VCASCTQSFREARRNPISETLSSLTIGSLTLTPEFSPNVFEYEVTTSNATNKVSATGDKAATIKITVNDTEIDSGDTVTWETGENEVVVKVTGDDGSNTYTVTVTAE